jgi:hypothetical protein
MDKVLREMVREAINAAISLEINNYMRNRVLKGKPEEENEILSNRLDPINMAARQLMDDYLRQQLKSMIRDEVLNLKNPNSLLKDYYYDAQFITYFKQVMLRPILRDVAKEAIESVKIGELIEQMVNEEADQLTHEVVHTSYFMEQQRESQLVFKAEAEKCLFDQIMFETMFDELMDGY